MGLFKRRKGQQTPPAEKPEDQAVLVHLDGRGLPNEVYERYDIVTIEDQLIELLEGTGLGEFDGIERGQGEATLFLYGPDAELLFAAIDPLLRAYPLCRNARVVVRRGAPGAPEREVRLP